jgi:hypothetical protein
VDLREHRPYGEISCFAPCVIYDREGASEEELEEQQLLDKFGHCSIAGEELSEGSQNHPEEGGRPPEGGGSEAGSEERQRARGKGKAKVEESWCTDGWRLRKPVGATWTLRGPGKKPSARQRRPGGNRRKRAVAEAAVALQRERRYRESEAE